MGGKKRSLSLSDGPDPGCMRTVTPTGSRGSHSEPARDTSPLRTLNSCMVWLTAIASLFPQDAQVVTAAVVSGLWTSP